MMATPDCAPPIRFDGECDTVPLRGKPHGMERLCRYEAGNVKGENRAGIIDHDVLARCVDAPNLGVVSFADGFHHAS